MVLPSKESHRQLEDTGAAKKSAVLLQTGGGGKEKMKGFRFFFAKTRYFHG